MAFIISIQGGMASGKTTLAKYIESTLKHVKVSYENQLYKLRQCSLDGILYLNASPEVLHARKEKDVNRGRSFFEHYINRLHTYKKQWFSRYIINIFKCW